MLPSFNTNTVCTVNSRNVTVRQLDRISGTKYSRRFLYPRREMRWQTHRRQLLGTLLPSGWKRCWILIRLIYDSHCPACLIYIYFVEKYKTNMTRFSMGTEPRRWREKASIPCGASGNAVACILSVPFQVHQFKTTQSRLGPFVTHQRHFFV